MFEALFPHSFKSQKICLMLVIKPVEQHANDIQVAPETSRCTCFSSVFY